jgi:hypothetical protein
MIKSWDTWQNITCPHCSPKKLHYLIVSNNTYMANQRMKAYFVDLFFIQNSLSFMTSVTCDLSNVTIKILVTDVASIKTNRKDQLQNGHFLLMHPYVYE